MRSVEPHTHELDAHLHYPGLDLYFGADRRVKDGGGSVEAPFEVDGEGWVARLSYQSSNLLPPRGGELPNGRPFHLEEVREYRLLVKRSNAEDPHGQQSFSTHISPRWSGLKGERADGSLRSIPVPESLEPTGVNLRIQGSNIALDRYERLLKRAAEAVGLNPAHVAKPASSSNVTDLSREVRIHKETSGPVQARDGPIASLAHLLEGDRDGYRKLVQQDRDDHGTQLPGYYHTVTLGPKRVREVFPTHSAPI